MARDGGVRRAGHPFYALDFAADRGGHQLYGVTIRDDGIEPDATLAAEYERLTTYPFGTIPARRCP